MLQKITTPCEGGCTEHVFIGAGRFCAICFLTIDESAHWGELPREFKQLAKKFAKKRRKNYVKSMSK